jgi:hypothetical protein
MKTNRKLLAMGIILLISGVIAALINFDPSRILQLIFVVASLTIGVIGIVIGRKTKGPVVRSTHFWWIGVGLIGLSIGLVFWASSLTSFISVVGIFLMLLAFTEFGFALQILINQIPIPWKVVGLKLTLSATAAIGAASILKIAGLNVYFALLFLGVLFVIVGLTIIQLSRTANHSHSPSVGK